MAKQNIWDDWEILNNLGAELQNKERENNIKVIINYFSKFLTEFDRQYCYNETFLPFCSDEFFKYLECFHRKFPFVRELLKVNFKVPDKISSVILLIDRYWKCEIKKVDTDDFETTDFNFRYMINESPNYQWLYEDELKIECSLQVESKRFIYQGTINLNTNKDQVHNDILKHKDGITNFLKYGAKR